ncbi:MULTISPECIES: DegT/DnrJ/EryC1/StrS family aminotransferase [Aminobacterium]|uniref:DegT/DnrJ/EryC1/StrS family aminotransferase n=1 Tax=Aminobacterium TaxID=81466 RepID=UPI0025803CB1|nr:DegT/DnrJ/EryC1/StrS family aminotransferase [Aminobacterium sp. UBA4834]
MGNKDFIPFALPDIGQDEIDEVVDSLQSGWLTTGPKTRQFEKEFAHYLGDNIQALAVNSATAGLHLALEAIGIKPGDEVITTTYTFTSTAEVIRYLGAHPVFVDVDPKTLNIDVKRVEHAITSRTKAIIPVHIAGLPCDMDSILSIAHKHNLKVVEDAAHAFPVHYREKYIGTLSSDVTVFSFYATKTITTGEGGMVVTANPEIAKRCSIMRLHGIDRDAFDRYTSEKPSWYYEIVAPGFKYNMTDIAASIGIHQLKKAHAFKEKRTAIAKRYAEAFKDLPVTLPVMPQTKEDHAWHLFILRLTENAPLSRNEFIQKMSEAGIGCSVHFIPLHMHPYWQKTYQLREEDYPIATRAYKGAVSLPIYTKMTDKDVDKVIKTVRSLLKP